MNQQTLFASTPASRATDPETSHLAEEESNANGTRADQQHRTLAALRQHPGSTSAELARLAGLDRYMVARRLPELAPIHARRAEKRTCRVSHRPAITWAPIERNGTGAAS